MLEPNPIHYYGCKIAQFAYKSRVKQGFAKQEGVSESDVAHVSWVLIFNFKLDPMG